MSAPVISGWSAVSPYGMGREAFTAGLRAGVAGTVELDPASWTVPQPRAHLVPGFEVREVLGRKGSRSMDRVSALAVTAVRELFDADPTRGEDGDDTALVLGTTTGSVKGMMDITRDTLRQEKPYHIETGRIPNAIMNSAAAQCAIWHQMFGPNTTVAGGRVAGLFALQYAIRLLESGRAAMVLCGGAEEYTAERAWLEHHGSGPDSDVLGEGCALLTVEPADDADVDRPALAEVVAVGLGVHSGDDLAAALERCLRRTLTRAEVRPADVWAVCSAAPGGALGDGERAALAAVFDTGQVLSVLDGQPWGDAGAVTATFQIAAVLGLAETDPAAAGRVAVVTSADRDGVLGCAVLRTARA